MPDPTAAAVIAGERQAASPSGATALPARGPLRPLAVAVLAAALLGLAELPFAAFVADDLMHLAVLEGVSPSTWTGPFELYTLSDGEPAHVRTLMDSGALPWFFGPGFKMAFFRPLSSALLATDHALWGLWPVGHRLQGIGWFILLVVGFGLVLRRVLPGPVGTLALVVFTLSNVHGSLCWNATRHVVVAGALATLALAAHVSWRETGWRPGRVASVVGFALALTASEAAVGVLAYLVAYEALAAPRGWATRLRAVGPVLAMLVVYAAVFVLGGYGARGGGYLDPFADPVAFLTELPGRVVFLLGTLAVGGTADLWILRPEARGALTLAAGALVVGFALLLRAAWGGATDVERRGSAWLIAGAAAATIPFAGSPLGARCLVLPMLGGSVAVAFVLRRWWATRSGPSARLVSAACIALAIAHLVAGPVQRLVTPYAIRSILHDRLATAMRETELDGGRLAGSRVVVLHAPDFVIGLHAYFFRALHRMPMARSWRTLSWAPCAHRFTRTSADTLDLELDGCDLEAPTLAAGDVITLDGMHATVRSRGALGPTRVTFRFDQPLDDPALRLLTWRDGRLRHVVPPEVGGQLDR